MKAMSSKNKNNNWEKQFRELEKRAVRHEQILQEAGYAGGPSSVDGSATFRGGPYGFGGVNQLAAGLSEPVKKLKKQRDEEAVYNIASQQRINRGYPAPQSVTGFPGGESNSGIRSGQHFPTEIEPIAVSSDDLSKMAADEDPTDDYFGFDDDELEDMKDRSDRGLKEFGVSGAQGAMRGVPSDKNYRDLPGWPRHNSLEKPGNFVPEIEGDEDGDGEEDDYLTDEEYVNDVLRLNGMGVKPGHLKKLFGQGGLEESALYERTLYHGTVIDHKDSIEQYGLTGELGDWVKDAYGLELDEEDWEEQLGGITFAAQKSDMSMAVGAMRFHIGKKLGKSLRDVTIEDIRRWGMLVVIKDVEEEDDSYGDGWKQRPPHGQEGYYDEYPVSVEPGDWFTKEQVYIDHVLTGGKLIDFLRRHGALRHVTSQVKEDKEAAARRELIKLAVAYHDPKYRDDIVNKVKQLSGKMLQKQLENYRDIEEAHETIAQKRAQRYGGTAQKQRGQQLKFDFGEALSLKNVFLETYVAPPYGPEPDKGTEHYKRGNWEETPIGDDWLINPVDHSGGHAEMPAAKHSPGRQAYGQIGSPKDFVPEDWEQRHSKTKEEPMDPEELKKFIESVVKEAIREERVNEEDLVEGSKNEPTNPELWSRAKVAAKRKYDVYPSAYANAYASKWYKDKGGGWRKKKKPKKESLENIIRNLVKEEMGVQEKVHKDSGLGKWFGEKWVDISRKKKSGGHPECGASADKGKRKSDSSKAYPKCVKKSKAQSMTKKEKESATRRKRAKPNKPGKPDNTATDKTKKEAYTGIDDKTGRGEPKGGSKAFQKSRKKVFDYDEEHKPKGIEDLKNYHMDD